MAERRVKRCIPFSKKFWFNNESFTMYVLYSRVYISLHAILYDRIAERIVRARVQLKFAAWPGPLIDLPFV